MFNQNLINVSVNVRKDTNTVHNHLIYSVKVKLKPMGVEIGTEEKGQVLKCE